LGAGARNFQDEGQQVTFQKETHAIGSKKGIDMREHVRGIAGGVAAILMVFAGATGAQAQSSTSNRLFEWTIESKKPYADPFNDVDVDVIFSKDGQSWRVPTFWRGGNKWTVRFAPPTPGEYAYHLESTDRNNPDLNGHEGRTTITAYTGANSLLRRGMLRVSQNKRFFEHADGTPFYWLGDTWWTGMSDRLNWEGFQTLTADRKKKGFTVVQIVAGLVPPEEQAPTDPGYCNEGGCVWDPQFKQINPKFFDYADRRVQHLVDSEIAPAIVGAWGPILKQISVAHMEKHWRYVIARYGAYPVFWVVGGEVFDPPEEVARKLTASPWPAVMPGWSEVARYIRTTDPYHHPLTVHQASFDKPPLQEESLTDFDLFQPSHMGWPSIAVEVAQLDVHRARTTVTKPEVVGEIGYEKIGETHLEDFQRTAFWLGMLNGAAGHTYGAVAVWESYTPDKPLHRFKWSFQNWPDAMKYPGSYQVGIASKLLRQYPWWRFEPHPDWVTPRGTTLLEPRIKLDDFSLAADENDSIFGDDMWQPMDAFFPGGEWKAHNGNFRLPYAAGIPGEVRFIYIPCFGLGCFVSPTVMGLESGVRYHAFYWEPSLGIKIDLGAVERPSPGATILEEKFDGGKGTAWTDFAGKGESPSGKLSSSGEMLTAVNGVNETNLIAAVSARSNADAALVLRLHDKDNYLAAVYSPKDKAIYLLDRKKGADGKPLRKTPVPEIGPEIRLTAEVRGSWASMSVSDGKRSYSSGIVRITNTTAGNAGLRHSDDGNTQSFADFVLQKSPTLATDDHLERKLYDAEGVYRGEMTGGKLDLEPALEAIVPGWGNYGKEKIILLDQYRPPKLPTSGDWLLVLEKAH
jgi:hypothetical protein